MHKILVVEDLAALRQHMATILRNTVPDVEIIEAHNGQQGLEMFRQHNPDMIVLDIVMPEMTGIKAAQLIWSEKPKTKIIFWSQFQQESYVREIGKIVPDEAIHGYALKTESDEKLAHGICSVLLQDNPYIDPVIRGVQHSIKVRDNTLNEGEQAILVDVLLGLTDKAIARRQHISVRGVQNRISALSEKLVRGMDVQAKETTGMEVFNTRVCIVLEAFRQGYVQAEDIVNMQQELATWAARHLNLELQDYVAGSKLAAKV